MKKLSFCFLGVALLSSCYRHSEETVPVINGDSNEVVQYVPWSTLEKKVKPIFSQIESEAISTLENYEAKTPWELTRLTVGLELKAEAEFFDVFEAETEGVIEFRFQKRL